LIIYYFLNIKDEKSSSIAIDANEIPNNDLEILIKMEHANRYLCLFFQKMIIF
jgi:hypothetical protein